MDRHTIKEYVEKYYEVYKVALNYRVMRVKDGRTLNDDAKWYLTDNEYIVFKTCLRYFHDSLIFSLSFEDGYDEECSTYMLCHKFSYIENGGEYITEFDDTAQMRDVYLECINAMVSLIGNEYFETLVDRFIND